MAITLRVNGTDRPIDADPGTPLLWVLRDHLQLTGTKFGCGIAQCGACTVHLDGQPVRACVTPLSAVGRRAVLTIEGAEGKVADAVRTAWTTIDVPQCGYCQSGQVMSAIALLSQVPRPTNPQIDAAMTGNVCRCATYARIRAAIHEAAAVAAPGTAAAALADAESAAAESGRAESAKGAPAANAGLTAEHLVHTAAGA